MDKSIPKLWSTKAECCGCSACYAVCPTYAIEMKKDSRGFLYPVIDEQKCIGCKSCTRICAYKKDLKCSEKSNNKHSIYAVKAKDKDVVKNSSSGGMFTVLSDWIISQNGAIVSALYNSFTHKVEFKIYEDTHTRNQARGSKYIQADSGDVFKKALDWIKFHPDKNLLFIGTGCQASGFAEYTLKNKVRNRVIIVDLICHGAPSPGLWERYASDIEKKQGNQITRIAFKDKKNGWLKPSVYALIGEKEVSIEGYSTWFYGEYSIRESCFQCPYTKIERSSDITIGDYWGVNQKHPEFYDFMGVSLAILQSEQGRKVFEEIRKKVDCIEVSEEECLQPRLISPANKPKNYDKFWNDIETKGFEYCEKKYKEINHNSLWQSVKGKLMKIVRIKND